MTENDQKSVWEYHLGVETIHFCDLGCPGRYYGVLESDFYGGETIKVLRKFPKVTNVYEMTGNDQKSVWEHHLGTGAVIFIV